MAVKAIKHRKTWLYLSCLSTIGVVFLMLSTTPQEVGPGGVMMWFGVAYVAIVTAPVALISYFKKTQSISARFAAIWSLISVVLVAMLALQSLGQLQIRDILLVFLLLLLFSFYVWRIQKNR